MYPLNNRVFLNGKDSGTEWRAKVKKLLEGTGIPVSDELDKSDPEMCNPYEQNQHFIHDRVILMYSGNEECLRPVGENFEERKNFPGLESWAEMGWPELVWSSLYTPPKEAGQQLFLVIEDVTDCDPDYIERRKRMRSLHDHHGARVFLTLEAAVEAIKEEMAKATPSS